MATLEERVGALEKVIPTLATKDDLKNFATKDDLKQFKLDIVSEFKKYSREQADRVIEAIAHGQSPNY